LLLHCFCVASALLLHCFCVASALPACFYLVASCFCQPASARPELARGGSPGRLTGAAAASVNSRWTYPLAFYMHRRRELPQADGAYSSLRESDEEEPFSLHTETASCVYCISRGKVHRRCLRLSTCGQVWKRGAKKRTLETDAHASARVAVGATCRAEAQPSEPPRVLGAPRAPRPVQRMRRAQGLPPKRIERGVTTRGGPVAQRQALYAWPFPVIVPPEALAA